jgi:prostamide/prostaglandin F2alpha synthase
VQLHRDRSKFDATGARLVVIGQGTPDQGADFLKTLKIDLPLYVDKSRDSYRAAGTKVATFSELLGPRVVAKGAAAARRDGVIQGKIVGHAAQLGGVMVVRHGGDIVYAHLSDDASDLPPNEEVLEAAKEASRP